jgi:hypothetical protein
MAAQAFSTRSACAVPVLHVPRGRRRAALTNLARSPHPCRRAVIGSQGSSPSPGPLASGASRPTLSVAAPDPLSLASPRGTVAEPKHASRTLPAPARRRRAILGAEEEVPMRAIAPPVGIAEPRRPRRLSCRATRRAVSLQLSSTARPLAGHGAATVVASPHPCPFSRDPRGFVDPDRAGHRPERYAPLETELSARGKPNPAGREITREAQLCRRRSCLFRRCPSPYTTARYTPQPNLATTTSNQPLMSLKLIFRDFYG